MQINKFDRVVSILLLLQTKKIVRAQDLADRFEVSLRTIYRDLRSLELAGIPIQADAGVGYSLVDGYNLPPVMFTNDEALSFLVADKIVEKMTSKDTSKAFASAVDKIKAVLKENDKETFNNLSNHIHVAERLSSQVNFGERYLQEILTGIDKRRCLRIDYQAIYNNGEKTTREIEPVGIQFYSSYWHLIAYCRLRKAYRDFRIDRMEKLELLDLSFEKKHPSLQEYIDKITEQTSLYEIEILFEKEAARYAGTQKLFYGFTRQEEQEGLTKMTFLNSSLDGMAKWLLIFIDQITVVKPVELNDKMIQLAERIAKNYLKE